MTITQLKKILRRFPRKAKVILYANEHEYPIEGENIVAGCDQDGNWKIKFIVKEENLDKAE